MNIKILKIFIVLSSITFIYSCNNNPVTITTPGTISDTVDYYDWDSVYIGGLLLNVYVADSNNIWIASIPGGYFYDGTSMSYLNLGSEFRLYNLGGYDKQNIFYGGRSSIINNESMSTMKKSTNGVITTTIILDSTGGNVFDVFVENQDNAWFSTELSNNIFNYTNGNINKYTLNEDARRGWFFRNPAGNLYYFGFDFNASEPDLLFTYKFDENNFNLIKTDTMNLNGGGLSEYIFRCGDDAVMGYSRNYYYFTGSEWAFHSSNVGPLKLGGFSKDSLVSMTNPFSDFYIYGSDHKWRIENDKPGLPLSADLLHTNLMIVEGRVYTTFYSYNTAQSYLIIGKPTK